MENPYLASSPAPTAQSSIALKTFLQRCAAILLFLAGWVCVGLVVTASIKPSDGELPFHQIPEAELTALQSFQRFSYLYWFTAFVVLSPPFILTLWLILKRTGVQRTRWLLLGIGLAASPLLLILAWLLFRSLLFP